VKPGSTAEAPPFAVLGIPPTLDPAAVKRAYFAGLRAHPPHVDPEGFRRLRSAYEALTAPGGLAHAFATAPVDGAAELAAWREAWGDRIARAVEDHLAAGAPGRAAEAFVAAVSALSLEEAAARWKER
jgi:curved DNA-binding protein CbpA